MLFNTKQFDAQEMIQKYFKFHTTKIVTHANETLKTIHHNSLKLTNEISK